MALPKIQYADAFQPEWGIPWAPIHSDEVLAKFSDEQLRKYVEARQMVDTQSQINPIGASWTLESWNLIMENWKKYSVHVLLGGNQCLASTSVITDPITKVSLPISQWAKRGAPLHVLSMTTTGVRSVQAGCPFLKGVGQIYEVAFSNTKTIRCASSHKFLTPFGWQPISEICVGKTVASCASHRESLHASVYDERHEDAPTDFGKDEGSQECCSPYFHPSGEPPLLGEADGPKLRPSPCGAQGRSPFRWRSDEPDRARADNREDFSSSLHSICDAPLHAYRSLSRGGADARAVSGGDAAHAFSPTNKCSSETAQQLPQSLEGLGLSQCKDDGEHFDPASLIVSCAESIEWVKVVKITYHDVGPYYDLTVPVWTNYIANGIVHANSGKSSFGHRMSVWAAGTIPQGEVYNFHLSEKRSIDDAQRGVYGVLPESIRNIPTKKGVAHNLQYSQKNGFTDGICILPPHPGYRRGGSIKFYNYAQYQQNDQIIEGVAAHLFVLEEKVPLPLLETLMFRLFTLHGRILIVYTVVDGWNPTIEKILAKTRTLKSRYCDHPKIKANLPIMQESLSLDSCAIYYAHTDQNPFTDWNEFNKLNATAPRELILARAYGVPTKSMASAFPLFSKEYAPAGNVVKHEDLPWLNLKKNKHGAEVAYPITRFMGLDPAGSKNWAMGWVAIDASGTWWIYAEWPDESYGDWALGPERAGPAQKGLGFGIDKYVEIIKQIEGGDTPFERIIDPRLGNAESQGKEGARTLISDLEESGMTFIPAPAAASEANVGEIQDGLQLLNNLLAYDTTKPIDSLNRPHLYVSDRCQNFIYCLSEYTAKLGTHEATKDFCDILRYLRKANCEFIDANVVDNSKTGVY